VTRFGEFSPIGQLFTWVIFSKISEVAQILRLFSTAKFVCSFYKIGLGYILGDFVIFVVYV
jgi:hypothetical protein